MKNNRLSQVVWVTIILTASSCVSQTQLPDELLGIWKTGFTVTKVERKKLSGEEWVLYTVFYQNDSLQKLEFPFYYNPAKNGVIRFKNQENLVWKKEIQ